MSGGGGVWGVGCYDAPGGRRPWRVGNDEIARDMASAQRRLGELGVGGGDRVLFCSMLSEAAQFWPWIVATMFVGAQLSCADATEGEGARVAMFLDRMTFRAVLGVTPAVLDGIEARGGDLARCFADVGVIGARPGAYERLLAYGLAPRRFALCGPAVAVADSANGAACIDATEWRLDAEHDDIVVSSQGPRLTDFDRVPVALAGTVVDDGKAVTW